MADVGQHGGAVPISMQQSSWMGPHTQSADLGMRGGLAPAAPGSSINAIYGQTGMVPGAHAQQGVAMGMSGGGLGQGISFEAGDFGSVLRTMNAERMQMEGELREDEDQALREFSSQQVNRGRWFNILSTLLCVVKKTLRFLLI